METNIEDSPTPAMGSIFNALSTFLTKTLLLEENVAVPDIEFGTPNPDVKGDVASNKATIVGWPILIVMLSSIALFNFFN